MKSSIILCFIALLAFFASSVSAASASGITTAMHAGAVNKIVDQVLPGVIAQIKSATFSEISGSKSHIHYKINSIKMDKLSVGAFTMSAVDSLRLDVKDLDVSMSMKWSYKTKIGVPRGSGTATASLSDGNIGGSFLLGMQGDGKPQLIVKSVTCKIGKVTVKTHKSLFSWLYNIIVKAFSSTIKSTMETAVKAGIEQGVAIASATILATMPTQAPVSEWGLINFGLTGSAMHSNNAVIVPFNGEIVDLSGKSDGQTLRHNIELKPNGSLFQIALDTFVFNSAFHTSFKKQVFHKVITEENRPASFPLPLNTAAFKLITALYAKYPDAPMKLDIAFGEQPLVTAVPGTASIALPVAVHVACLVSGVWQDAFTIRVDAGGALALSIDTLGSGQAIFAQVQAVTSSFSIVNSSIGDFDLTILNVILNTIINVVVVPAVNAELLAGIPFPSVQGLALTNTRVNIVQDAIMFDTDLEYNP